MPATTVWPAFERVMAINLPKPVLVPVMKMILDMILRFVIVK
jgi:hypothetical protein